MGLSARAALECARSDAALARDEQVIARSSALQQRVRETLIARFTLRGGSGLPDPPSELHAMWAGRAQARGHCAGCDRPIEQGAIEYEPEFLDGRTLKLHPHCVEVWIQEHGQGWIRERAQGSSPGRADQEKNPDARP